MKRVVLVILAVAIAVAVGYAWGSGLGPLDPVGGCPNAEDVLWPGCD